MIVLSLVVYLLYTFVIDIPRMVLRAAFDLLNMLSKPFRYSMLLIRVLLGEYAAYALTGILSLFFKGGAMERIHGGVRSLYFLQLNTGMKDRWDSFFSVPGPVWDYFANLPNTLPMNILRGALILNIFSIGVVLAFAFTILLNYKVILLFFVPELIFRLFRLIYAGEPITLGFPYDYYNPFDPESMTKSERRDMEAIMDNILENNDKRDDSERQGTATDDAGYRSQAEMRTKEHVPWRSKGILRAREPGYLAPEEAASIAKRQARRKYVAGNIKRRSVPGVRYRENPYSLRPKETKT